MEYNSYLILVKYAVGKMKYYGPFRIFEDTVKFMDKIVKSVEKEHNIKFEKIGSIYCLSKEFENKNNIPLQFYIYTMVTELE